jgi:hypothetical protein
MHAGDRLHGPPVAVAETVSVHRFHASEIRRPVVRDRYLVVGGQLAGHARGPQQLAVETARNEGMDIAEKLQRFPVSALRRRDELRQRLRIVGRDVGVRQRGAPARRMRPVRQPAVGADAQRLLFDTAQPVPDQRDATAAAQPGEARRERPARGRVRG